MNGHGVYAILETQLDLKNTLPGRSMPVSHANQVLKQTQRSFYPV